MKCAVRLVGNRTVSLYTSGYQYKRHLVECFQSYSVDMILIGYVNESVDELHKDFKIKCGNGHDLSVKLCPWNNKRSWVLTVF